MSPKPRAFSWPRWPHVAWRVRLFQEVVEDPNGGGIARRVTGIDEVIGYNKHSDGVLTRGMFEWDPVKDKHYFRGMFQSHLLENKIAAVSLIDTSLK